MQTLDGSKTSFNLEPTCTIAEAKEQVAEHQGIEGSMMRLIFNGKNLADEETIGSYNIGAGA